MITTTEFETATYTLYKFIREHAEQYGWHWFLRRDNHVFYIWHQSRFASVQCLRRGDEIVFEVFTDAAADFHTESIDDVNELVFGALTRPET